MAKFIIKWDAGDGETYEIVELDNLIEAEDVASNRWREEAESNADYNAYPYSEVLAHELGLE